jgi:cysteine desulfurase
MFRFRREVYLDNNATTRVSHPVRTKIEYVLKHCFGNPSSLYKEARDAAQILDESRRIVAETIGADISEIFFTGSASEGNNAVLKSVSEYFYPSRKKIVSTPIEHASVISTLRYLESRGITVEYCTVDEMGRIDPYSLEKMIDDDTFLLCVMYANNETGTLQDIPAISRIAGKKNTLIFSDCVQALGKIRVDVKELGLDYATFSAHKIHGPKGIGALYIREGAPFIPLIHGGHQEFGKRAGTEGLHNIAGFAEACRSVDRILEKSASTRDLKMFLVEEIRKIKNDIMVNSPQEHCLPNTVSITFPGVNNAVFMAMLDSNGIAVSAGSACNTQDDSPSHVLKAIGLSDQAARETIRFSLSSETSRNDIIHTLKIIREHFEIAKSPVNIVMPGQLRENLLFDKDTYILDVRFWYDRRILKGLPNSHEASFFSFRKYLKLIPRDKNIITVCQMGYNAPIVALYLKSKHYKNVGFLFSGLFAWKLAQNELYKKYAGQNIEVLKPSS